MIFDTDCQTGVFVCREQENVMKENSNTERGNVYNVSTRVSKYISDTGLSKRRLLASDVHSMGLEVLSTAGFYAALVASVPDAPNIVVKVCEDRDGYVSYALLCYHGCLTGPHYPVVYSATKVDGLWIFVIERLEPAYRENTFHEEDDFEEDSYRREGIEQSMLEDLSEYFDEHELTFDSHAGNWMLRGDQLVFIDPLSSKRELKFDEQGVPKKIAGYAK